MPLRQSGAAGCVHAKNQPPGMTRSATGPPSHTAEPSASHLSRTPDAVRRPHPQPPTRTEPRPPALGTTCGGPSSGPEAKPPPRAPPRPCGAPSRTHHPSGRSAPGRSAPVRREDTQPKTTPPDSAQSAPLRPCTAAEHPPTGCPSSNPLSSRTSTMSGPLTLDHVGQHHISDPVRTPAGGPQ